MTPQELTVAVRRYLDIVHDPATNQKTFQAALAAVQAAHAAYEAAPTAVYPSGAFVVQCGQMVVVDAFGTADYAVPLPSVSNGRWRAWVGVVAGVHVALFAWHDTAVPDPSSTLHDLIRQTSWLEVGSVPIDTATCAIADQEAYIPLDVDEVGYQIAGVDTHLCFSNTANADGGYPVFVQVEDGKVTGIYVEFVPLTAMIG
ncbi:MAG: hypothetical protein IPM39_26635 [Chloroflexi bacterium]|nr:hypothetical protein [Chloroflexota bacterium]